MVDRTAEDIIQDQKLARLDKDLATVSARLDVLALRVANLIDQLAHRREPTIWEMLGSMFFGRRPR